MNPARTKALANGAKRPLTTSKLNPYAMRRIGGGIEETRISPRLSALNKQRAEGKIWLLGNRDVSALAEAKANYVPGSRAEGRQAAADMLRRYRKTGYLSASLSRLVDLHARFAGQSK